MSGCGSTPPEALDVVQELPEGAHRVGQHVGQIAQLPVAPVVQLRQARPGTPLQQRQLSIELELRQHCLWLAAGMADTCGHHRRSWTQRFEAMSPATDGTQQGTQVSR